MIEANTVGSKGSETSLKELEAAAEAGEGNALQALAMLHELGLVPHASTATAVLCYTKAVRAGSAEAAIALAHLQERNPNQNPQRQKVIEGLYQFAAAKGFHSAALRLQQTYPKQAKGMVIVVDPTDASRLKTKSILEAAGYMVQDFFDPYKALRLVENDEPIDLIISDVQMKVLDGVEMLQLIRQRYLRTDIPVMLLSQSSSVEALKRAKTYGVQAWVIKPYDADALLQSVQKLVASASKTAAKKAS